MRINRFLSQNAFCSRRKADQLISEGRVTINQQVCHLGSEVTDSDQVRVDGQLIQIMQSPLKIWAYNKPRGVECTLNLKTPNNLLQALPNIKERFVPIGRLDKDSEGLLLLTNNPSLVHCVTHASFEHEKVYVVEVNRPIDENDLIKIREGIFYDGRRTAPAKVKVLSRRKLQITLIEGRKRQIRRMLETLDYGVKQLMRIKVMHVELGHLKKGTYRLLLKNELEPFISLLDLKNRNF